MKTSKIEVLPLDSKYYSTEIRLKLNGNGWDFEGTDAGITIWADGDNPSIRELEKGYYSDDGMNHVETEEAYRLAMAIVKALKNENF